jgi:hypothetical protein
MEEKDWYKPEFNDSNWNYATELGKAPCAPWNNLYERTIPFLKDYGLKDYINADSVKGITTAKETVFAMKIPYNAQFTAYLDITSLAGKKNNNIF